MKLSEFRFDLPQNLIALNPTENREDARMMVVNRKNKTIEHKKFTDIIDYFGEGDVLVGSWDGISLLGEGIYQSLPPEYLP